MSPTSISTHKKVLALLDQAYIARVSNLKQSLALANEALLLSRQDDDAALIAMCLSKLGLFKMILAHYEESVQLSNEALGIFQILGDERGMADVKYSIAGVYYKSDNYHLGLVYLIDCLEIYERLQDYHNQSRVHKSLGTIYEYFGDEKSAILSYEKAISTAQIAGDLNLESNAYNPLSGIFIEQNHIDKANELIERSIEMKRSTQDIRGLAFAIYGRAKVQMAKQEYILAEKTFFESIEIHLQMGENLGLGMSYHKLGKLYSVMNRIPEALQYLEKALEVAHTHKISFIKFKSNYDIYQIYKQQGDDSNALKYIENYLKEREIVINTQTRKVIESYEALNRMERLQKEAQMERERADLIERQNKVEHASKVKQDFLSTMSHEIRTPLNAVITITSLLSERSDDEQNKLIKSLKFSANNLMRIINDILDFSKLEAGKLVLEYRSVDILALMKNIQNSYRPLAEEKGVELLLQIDPKINQFYLLDDTKMSQIMGNLVSNAVKFTDVGHVEIRISYLEKLGDRDSIRISISDSGAGIPKSFLPEIFDSFSQPKSFITKKKGGTGLGLAIVKNLVGLHNGQVHVHSEEGKGSEFYFDLTLQRATENMTSSKQMTEDINNKVVLLAEDNAINAMVCKKLLSNWGLKTAHAKDGLEVVKMANEKKYDYILMDIHMPNLDGFGATKLIRESENPNKNTPIFALTADITAKHQEKTAYFFNAFLMKPIEQEKLHEALLTNTEIS
jgi:signal transduction histidine kinase/ActR/RegA family two-component response regulator